MGGLAPREHPSVLPRQLLVRPQRHDPALPAPARARRARGPAGDTDSEHFFNLLMHDYDPGDAGRLAARTPAHDVERSPFSGLNFLFSDGERLFAYRLGLFELHWLRRPGPAAGRLRARHRRAVAHASSRTCCSCSTRTTSRSRTPSACWATRCVGRRRVQKVDRRAHLRGEERGAGRRGARAAAAAAADGGEPPLRAAREPGVGRGPGAEGAPGRPRRRSTGSAPPHRTVTTRSIEHAARGGGPGRRPTARPSRRSAATGCCARSPAP